MTDAFIQALRAYVELIRENMCVLRSEHRVVGDLPVELRLQLIATIALCEESQEFTALKAAMEPEERNPLGGFRDIDQKLTTVFKGTGIYIGFAHDHPFPDERIIHTMCSALGDPSGGTRYLLPIDGLTFNGRDRCYSLPGFDLRTFSEAEICEAFDQEAAQWFYPHAVINAKNAADYWYIDVVVERIPSLRFTDLFGWTVPAQFLNYPPEVQRALEAIALWEWEELEGESEIDWPLTHRAQRTSWQGLSIPFVLSRPLSSLAQPYAAPRIPQMEYTPLMDSSTGEYYGEEPSYLYRVEEPVEFVRQLTKHARALARVRADENQWRFIDVAAGFLTRALLAKDLDQLLWNIVTIDALLGDGGGAITHNVIRRLCHLLSTNSISANRIENAFKALYTVRSNLVHGNEQFLHDQVYGAHLLEARRFARRSFVAMLDFLTKLLASKQRPLLNRRQILSCLERPASTK